MNISVERFLNLKNIIVIDIRSVEKYNDNHINNAINIPRSLIIKNPDKYLNKIDTYFVYCFNGKNSYKVCETLNKKGYKLVNIIGGYEAWILQS